MAYSPDQWNTSDKINIISEESFMDSSSPPTSSNLSYYDPSDDCLLDLSKEPPCIGSKSPKPEDEGTELSNHPQQQQQQQQQNVFYVSNHPPVNPVVNNNNLTGSMIGAIVLSTIVMLGFCMCFGIIALVQALKGYRRASAGEREAAIVLRNESYGFSIAGLVVGAGILGVYIYLVLYHGGSK